MLITDFYILEFSEIVLCCRGFRNSSSPYPHNLTKYIVTHYQPNPTEVPYHNSKTVIGTKQNNRISQCRKMC